MKLSFDEIQNHFEKQIKNMESDLEKKKAEVLWFNESYKRYFGKMFGEFGADIKET